MLSIWEKESFVTYDYIVVGGGITGLSAAASLAELQPGASILVMERGLFPSGASTKNAGFACFGSLSELADDLERVSEDRLVETVAMRYRGIQRLRQRLGDLNIGYEALGGYELISQDMLPLLDQMDSFNRMLADIFPMPYFSLANQGIGRFGFSPEHVRALVHAPHEGQIDTGKMMRSLQRYVQQKGVEIRTGCQVEAVEDLGHAVEVRAHSGLEGETVSFGATAVCVCTNAFSARLLPGLDIVPGRGQVLVTRPIPNLRIRGSFHIEAGYFYFRDHNKRLVVGGGRHLDFDGERTELPGTSPLIQQALLERLETVILPHTPFEIDYGWAGIMAFGQDKKPIVQLVSPRVAVGVRMGGMGVAIGSMVGDMVANLVKG